MEQANDIRRVAVIGAGGVMGKQIAAMLANAGVDVDALDIVPAGATDRDIIAKKAIEGMRVASSQSPDKDPQNNVFYDPAFAKRIRTGNLEDHLDRLKEADWIVEVIAENLDWKHALYEKIEKAAPNAMVSSNTSTMQLAKLVEGRSENFKQNFMITHFFNPVRHMPLVETVVGKDTRPDVIQKVTDFLDQRMGKNVVPCKDTPGFKGNRIGGYWLLKSAVEAVKQGIGLDEADAILGAPVGFKSSGVFGTMDVVGMATSINVMKSLKKSLPKTDDFHAVYAEAEELGILARMDEMLASGRMGRMAADGKGGFYRAKRDESGAEVRDKKGEKILEWLDMRDGTYHEKRKIKTQSTQNGFKGLDAVVETNDRLGVYARTVLLDTMRYAAKLLPEISDEPATVDAAMRDGYFWKKGPFEMIDSIGVDKFAQKLEKNGMDVPKSVETLRLECREIDHGRIYNHGFYRTKGAENQVYSAIVKNGFRGGWEVTYTTPTIKTVTKGVFGYADVPQKDGVLNLSDIKRTSKPVIKGSSASVWDIGDGVLCYELHSKLGFVDGSTLNVLNDAIKTIGDGKGQYKALVLHNEDKRAFASGANLGLALSFRETAQYDAVELMVRGGQKVLRALHEAPFPSVTAVHGFALGGGLEMAMPCSTRVVAPETYAGLVEPGVGEHAGWNGNIRHMEWQREFNPMAKGPFALMAQAFTSLSAPIPSNSAVDAKKKLWLHPDDKIIPNPERLLFEAKQEALRLFDAGYVPKKAAEFELPGLKAGAPTLKAGIDGYIALDKVKKHDILVTDGQINVLTGGKNARPGLKTTETTLQTLEREGFMSLVRTKGTEDRIMHMLKTGKPSHPKEPVVDFTEVQALLDSRPIVAVNENRNPDGKPVSGVDALELKMLAGTSTVFNWVAENVPREIVVAKQKFKPQEIAMGAIAYSLGYSLKAVDKVASKLNLDHS
jgi:3-hydroxyacyl-CoA dehydrogenase